MQVTGVVYSIGETQQVSEKFKKRDLILEVVENPEFKEYIKLEATQDRVNLFDKISEGEEVTIHFNLRGRLWTGKDGVETSFNSLVAWKIDQGSDNEEGNPSKASNDGLPF